MPKGIYKRPNKFTKEARLRYLTDRISIGDGCWEWLGNTDRNGYGIAMSGSRIGGNKRRVARAHRLSYSLLVGHIPDGLVIDHLCRNRRCVRPEHLEAVTFTENVLRGESFAAKQKRQTNCKRGHPLSGRNLYVRPDTGDRQCKACRNAAVTKYHLKRRAI